MNFRAPLPGPSGWSPSSSREKKSWEERKSEFRRGVAAVLPFVPGVVTLGVVYGLLARKAGLNCFQVWLMSALVHAGSAQLAVLSHWEKITMGTALAITLLINSRHFLMGASLSPYVAAASHPLKAFLALWLTDESYAVSIAYYRRGGKNCFYLLGANVGVYLLWTMSGLIGGLLGQAALPWEALGLELVFPLVFLGLLLPFLKKWIDVFVAGVVVVLFFFFRALGLEKIIIILTSLVASGVGVFLETKFGDE